MVSRDYKEIAGELDSLNERHRESHEKIMAHLVVENKEKRARLAKIQQETPYQILTVPCGILVFVGLRVDRLIPRTRVSRRLTQSSERRVKYRADGEWEISARSGHMSKKEVIECST